MAGSAMSRMLLLTMAISMPSVVLESTIHLYHVPCGRGSLTGENNLGCAVILAVPSLSCGCAAARPSGHVHRVEQCPQGTCRTRQACDPCSATRGRSLRSSRPRQGPWRATPLFLSPPPPAAARPDMAGCAAADGAIKILLLTKNM